MEIKARLFEQAKAAREAARRLAATRTAVKNEALLAMADALTAGDAGNFGGQRGGWGSGTAAGHENRLSRSAAPRCGAHQGHGRRAFAEAALPDPVGEGVWSAVRPNGLEIRQVRVPLGVVGIIYEARPNVTADAAGLCLKSGNAVLLRGGSEALRSNRVLARLLAQAAEEAGIPQGAVAFVDSPDRQAVEEVEIGRASCRERV